MTKQSELIAYVFDGLQGKAAGVLSDELRQWMEASTRFTAFVETYRDKIRKKVRVTREAESLFDLRSELALAYCLLNDRRFALVYEPYASAKRRGPDFAVTYRANQVFNIEVARIRVEEADGEAIDLTRKEERILRILMDKLAQMQAGMPNLLAIHTHPMVVQSIDLGRLMQAIKTRAESKDPAFYDLSRYASPAAFYKDFLHLSGMLLWGEGKVNLWSNKQARPMLEEKVLRVVAQVI